MTRSPALAAWCVAAALAALAPAARADGAFPDGWNVFFPASKPHRVAVATTFGLAVSEDDGAHWRYVCEPYITPQRDVVMYQSGPDGSIFAIAGSGLFRTDDGGCSWHRAGGALARQGVTDAFVDPDDASHVLALSFAAGYRSAVYESHDHGDTFDAPLFTTADVLLSIEIAPHGHGRTYASAWRNTSGAASAGLLLHADDPHGRWSETRVADEPAAGVITRITSADPTDPSTVYLRLSPTDGASGDELGVSTDGGARVTSLLALGASMGGFARADDGTLYVGGRDGRLWRRDAGATAFVSMPSPAVRCLGTRDGTVYVCGDSRTDRFALAASHDRGASFRPLLVLRDIEGPLACPAVQDACAGDWAAVRPVLLTIPYPDQPDAGAPDAGPVDAGAAFDAGAPPDAGPLDPPPPAGCGCAMEGGSLGALLVALARRGKGRPGAAPS